jgi:hypothetical protein
MSSANSRTFGNALPCAGQQHWISLLQIRRFSSLRTSCHLLPRKSLAGELHLLNAIRHTVIAETLSKVAH